MNKSFLTILSAPIEDRKGLFLTAANRLGIPIQNIEKDFWVCWAFDLLFNTRDEQSPLLLFKYGAKYALDPHQLATIKPYVSDDLPHINFDINNVITINAERTFWDKIIILHGIRRWHDLKGVLRQNGHRFSRHYYDV